MGKTLSAVPHCPTMDTSTPAIDSHKKVDLLHHDYRFWAAVITWLMVGIAYLYPFDIAGWSSAKWLGCISFMLYGISVYGLILPEDFTPTWYTLRMRMWVLALTVASLMSLVLALPRDISFVLGIILAGILPEYFRFKIAVLIQLSIHTTMSVLYMWRWPDENFFWLSAILWGGFHAFALLTSQIAAEERRARQQLQFSHTQLSATQNLLSATTRQDERLRISRDLHDVIGHHLTGLSLQLEVASHCDGEKARIHVDKAQMITKLLLADIRQVVDDLRDLGTIDLADSLRSLTENVGDLRIDLELPEELNVNDSRVAECVFRSVQEIITNCLKHAHATRLWIRVSVDGGQIRVDSRDDGTILELPAPGNGLKGMRERVEQLGGSLQLQIDHGLRYAIELKGVRA